MTKIHVVLADDHPLVRDGIRQALSVESDLLLVGEAADGNEAQRICQRQQPDVLLLDLRMPGPSPFETVTFIKTSCPETRILILTAHDSSLYIRRLVTAGVAGYILKGETTQTIIKAIRIVSQGKTWFSQPVVNKLIQHKRNEFMQLQRAGLTKREWEVLQWLAQGLNNRQIAEILTISERTVKNHVSNIYTKLNVRSRAKAVAWAWQQGLITPEDVE